MVLRAPHTGLGNLKFRNPADEFVLVTANGVRMLDAAAAQAMVQATGVFLAFSSDMSINMRAVNRLP